MQNINDIFAIENALSKYLAFGDDKFDDIRV